MPEQFITRSEAQRMIDEAVAAALAKFATAPRPYKIFGLNSSRPYADKVAGHLGIKLTDHTEKLFDDGECYVKSGPEFDESQLGNVRGHLVFVIQSLYAEPKESVSDKFMKLALFCGAVKDASAERVIPIIPHLGWARQDRKTESRAPIATKYIAKMLQSVGIAHALFFDVHNLAAVQNAYDVPIDNLEAKNPFADYFAKRLMAEGKAKKVKVMTPDAGGLSRTNRFRLSLLKRLNALGAGLDDIEVVIFDKMRIKGQVKGGRIIGDVKDAEVVAFDDMISTFSTMAKSCRAVVESGGNVYAICASHGLFCGKANDHLAELDTKVVIADTVEPWRLTDANKKKCVVIDTTKMVADAVRRIHSGTGSISELLKT